MTTRVSGDCRAALFMLDRLEAMLAGGWTTAASLQAWTIVRTLATALLAESGPQPGLAAWLSDQDGRTGITLEEARAGLRAALERGDVTLALIEAYGLARCVALALSGVDIPVT